MMGPEDRAALTRLYNLRMKKARKLERMGLFPQKQADVNEECRALFNTLYKRTCNEPG